MVLAVLLFFGPHLEFIEVTIVAALLLGGALKPELPKKLPWSAWIIAPCLGVVMFLSAYFSENGFFSWEKDGQDVYRWIGRRASGKIQCAENGIATMWLQAASPDVIYKDVIVKLETTVKPPKEIRLTDPLVKEIKISCSSGEPHLRLPPLFPQREMVRYRLTISRIWTPRKYIAGSLDSRPLGVRVFVGGVKEVIPAT